MFNSVTHARIYTHRLVDTLRPFPGMHHLDVAGGTGDVAFRVLRAIRQAEARSGQPPPTRPSPPSSSSSSHGHAATSSSHPEAHPSSEQASSMSTATQGVQGQDASSGSGGGQPVGDGMAYPCFGIGQASGQEVGNHIQGALTESFSQPAVDRIEWHVLALKSGRVSRQEVGGHIKGLLAWYFSV
eukprot:1161813-Pelagomonas_calceolata.AAC.11